MTPEEKRQRDQVVGEAFACRHALLAYAYGSLGDHAQAEDVVQNAFLVVMDKYTEFCPGTSMLAWCRSIVRLKVFEALRERNRLVTTEDTLLHEAIEFAFEDAQKLEQAAVRAERLEKLRACIGQLSPRLRALLEASLQPQASYGQIGRAMGMAVEAVRKGLYRIRQSLRECVAANTGGPA
ncbi:MAG: sigma-70 family RNA polymerase sigma factor [Rhodobacteraceae bacterium]|nr:sigma-70 family RNA polymerase sigma factor [Paracoccaceae bacterium]